MRLIQEYETLKGFLVMAELAKNMDLPSLENAMEKGSGEIRPRNS